VAGTDSRRRGQAALLPAVGLTLVLILVGGAAVLRFWQAPKETEASTLRTDPDAGDSVEFGQVPPFRLTDQFGASVSAADFAGAPWALAAIFTRCSGPCPQITEGMVRVQAALPEGSRARLVSLSVDPAYDTPAILAAYGDTHGADHERWSFLTGDELTIYQLLQSGFSMGVDRAPEEVEGMQVTHETRVAAVDSRGRIRGWYPVRTDEGVERLAARLRFLEAEGN